MNVAGVELRHASPVGGGDICRAYRAITPDGLAVFAKTHPSAPDDFFTAEAAGLSRLRDAGVDVPEVVAVGADGLVLSWVDPGPPTTQAAKAFGASLAALHIRPQQQYGAARPGYIGTLPLDNTPGASWGEFYVERRVLPYVDALRPDEWRAVEAVCERIDDLVPPDPPALLHGDLWSGNLLWSASGGVVLVDAASAHVGHRETDLAMLALFGAPYLDVVRASYEEIAPLADGWRERVPVHQLHPLLVHATLFGGGYGARAAAAARAALGAD